MTSANKYRWLVIPAMSALFGCAQPQVIWQSGPTIGLLNGVYDGTETVADIKKHGDQGVGLWDKANGEGLIVDGVFYQVTVDGVAHVKQDDDIMSWVMISPFQVEQTIALPAGTTLKNIGAYVDKLLPTVNTFYALRLEGTFRFVQSRSVPEQHKPYPPFSEVEQHEVKFDFDNVQGVMVGFRSPPYVTNMSVPNYHVHFLNQEKTSGGHVLEFVTDDVRLLINRVDDFYTLIPTTREFEDADLDHIIQGSSE